MVEDSKGSSGVWTFWLGSSGVWTFWLGFIGLTFWLGFIGLTFGYGSSGIWTFWIGSSGIWTFWLAAIWLISYAFKGQMNDLCWLAFRVLAAGGWKDFNTGQSASKRGLTRGDKRSVFDHKSP